MVKAEISSGKFKVLTSGSVFAFKDNPIIINFELNDKIKTSFTVEFAFVSDEDSEDAHIYIASDGDRMIRVELVNHNSIAGGGALIPELIAESDESKLYVIFRASNSADLTTRLLEYTFYSAPKEVTVKPRKAVKSKRVKR